MPGTRLLNSPPSSAQKTGNDLRFQRKEHRTSGGRTAFLSESACSSLASWSPARPPPAFSQSMMTAALPTIMHEFSVGATFGQLLTTGYIFTLGPHLRNDRLPGKTMSGRRSCFLVFHALLHRRLRSRACGAELPAPSGLTAPPGGRSRHSPAPHPSRCAFGLPEKRVRQKPWGPCRAYCRLCSCHRPHRFPGFLIDLWGWHSVFAVLGAVWAGGHRPLRSPC